MRPAVPGDALLDIAERIDASTEADLAMAAVGDLALKDRDLLMLVAWEDTRYKVCAEILGIPVGTVRSRLHRIRRELRSAVHLDDPTPEASLPVARVPLRTRTRSARRGGRAAGHFGPYERPALGTRGAQLTAWSSDARGRLTQRSRQCTVATDLGEILPASRHQSTSPSSHPAAPQATSICPSTAYRVGGRFCA